MFRDRLLWSGVGFVVGVALLQQLPALPPLICYLFLPIALVLWSWKPGFAVFGGLIVGFFWAMFCAQLRLADELPSELIGNDVVVIGTVSSIPEADEKRTRFEFNIEQQEGSPAEQQLPIPFKVRLGWYWNQKSVPPDIAVGQQWRLHLRLKPPIGFMNPGGFDYEGWLFSHNIRATGYVREHSSNAVLQQHMPSYAVSMLRSNLLEKLSDLTQDFSHQGILLALAIGYRNAINDQDWDLLLRTGTNHLMAISGLHIGMVAGLLYFLTQAGVNFFHARAWLRQAIWPAQRIAAMAGWLGALTYALLAGFALPTQRAMIMLTVGLFAVVAYRQLRPAQAITLALIAVLLIDPFAVNSAGFWLSFGAVAVLIYAYVGRKSQALPRFTATFLKWGKVQLVLLIGLLPLTIYWFGAAAITASVANLLAIPLVGLLVVPLVLLASLSSFVFEPLAAQLLLIADQCLSFLWLILDAMQHLPLSRWQQPQPPLWATLLALAGAALLLAPRGLPARWVGLFWFMPMLFYTPARPQNGEFYLSALDVGQGTAVVIQTAKHSLIYDAGPKFNEQFDAGKMVVLPYLKVAGIAKVDTLLISHGDNDHIGGSAAILDAIPVSRVISSAPGKMTSENVESCREGQNWVWDEVHFSILHPDENPKWQGNNSSCVLLVETGKSRVLLTGDIEKSAEQHLLVQHAIQPVSILFAPHHGSRTSSGTEFVERLDAQHVIFSAGAFNRHRFPSSDVEERYSKTGAQLWTTGEQGALEFLVIQDGTQLRRTYRNSERRYWHYL